jgi:SAM-dependent methyltransferase
VPSLRDRVWFACQNRPVAIRQWAKTFAGGRLSVGMAQLNARHPWSHNDHFHSWIVANLPKPCRTALDVGCGRGELVATLAPHVGRVFGNDADPLMRQLAAQRCAGLSNVTITGEDWSDGDDTYDLVTMVAVLHHLDLPDALHEVRRRLSSGGRFLAVGLAQPRTVRDHAWDVASMVTNPIIGYVKHPWPSRADSAQPPPFPVRDPTLSFDELRQLLEKVMPGAVIRHRLGFRHTIAWTKPKP